MSQNKVAAGVLSFPSSVYAEKMGLKVIYDLADSGIEIPTIADYILVREKNDTSRLRRVIDVAI